jgi:hypothetical protein
MNLFSMGTNDLYILFCSICGIAIVRVRLYYLERLGALAVRLHDGFVGLFRRKIVSVVNNYVRIDLSERVLTFCAILIGGLESSYGVMHACSPRKSRTLRSFS